MAAHWSARSTCTLRAESGCHRYLCLLCRFVFSEQIRSARFLCSVQLPMLCFHPVQVLNRSGNWPGSRRPWPCRPSSERAKGQSVSKYAKRCKPSSRTFANTRTMQTSGTAASIEAGLAPSPKVFSLKTWFARPHPPKRDLLSLDLLSFPKGPAFPSPFVCHSRRESASRFESHRTTASGKMPILYGIVNDAWFDGSLSIPL